MLEILLYPNIVMTKKTEFSNDVVSRRTVIQHSRAILLHEN